MLTIGHSRIAAVLFLAVLPFIGWEVLQTRITPVEVTSWLPAEEPAQRQYRQFLEQFGVDQFILLSWPGCTIDTPLLGKLAADLRRISLLHPELGIAAVENPSETLQALQTQFPRARRQAILDRLDGQAIARDGTAALVLRIFPTATPKRRELIESIHQSARRVLGEKLSGELVLAGEPVQADVIDLASRHAMQSFAVTSAILATTVAYACLRDLTMTCIVLAFSGVGQAIGLSLANLWIGSINALLIVVPTLVFMLTLSASVHLAKYFRDSGGWQSRQAGLAAIKAGGWPCLLAALTTIVGFLSLAVSHLTPVRQFGVLSAAALAVSVTVLLAVFPAVTESTWLLRRWLMKLAARLASKPVHQPVTVTSPVAPVPIGATGRWTYASYTRLLQRHASLTVVAGGLLGLAGAGGIWRLESTTSFESMFAATHPVRSHLDWIRTHIGPTKSLEVIIEFPIDWTDQPDNQWLDRLRVIQQTTATMRELPQAQTVLSCMTWVPNLPEGTGIAATLRRAAAKKWLEERWNQWRDLGLVSRDDNSERYRITIGYACSDNAIATAVTQTVEESLSSFAASSHSPDQQAAAQFHLTGLQTVLRRANDMLIRDLLSSFSLAFLLVTPAMLLATRRLWGGLWLMLPNLLPILLAFGAMGWIHVQLDVACVLTASVALGIAVDDTLHFVYNYMRGLNSSGRPDAAVQVAMQRCAAPMSQTTCICIASLSPFLFSEFLPTGRFATVMMLILAGAIIGDLVLLPALLLSPIGRAFLPRKHGNGD